MNNGRFHAGGLFIAISAAAACFGQVSTQDAYRSPAHAEQNAAGSIRGITRAPDGRPLPDVRVIVERPLDGSRQVVFSGPDGTFVTARLGPGQYRLTAFKDGYLTSSALVDLGASENLGLALALSSANFTGDSPGGTAGSSEAQAIQSLEQRMARLETMEARIDQLAGELERLKPPAAGASPATPPPVEATVAAPPAAGHSLPDLPLYASVAPRAAASVPLTAGRLASPAAPALPARPAPANALPSAAAPPQEKAPAAPSTPQTTPAASPVDNFTPFADYDWTWLNGNPRTHEPAFDTPFFTPEIRADLTYTYDFNRPKDNSMGGSSEEFRSNEIQLEQLGVGGDFHWENVRARFMTQFGDYSTATARNDASYAKGQWDLSNAYRYLSEAYGGYHLNALHGINIDAGIFMSYVGLFSYYNFDNWAYQPSFVSSNTPWFFEGIRVQIFPTHHLKIEPWFINGWQSYASANARKGIGGQIKYTPFSWMNIISNNYGLGHDDLYIPNRARIHTDNSVEVKYYDRPGNGLDKMAFSFTGDLGCEFGGGVSCHGDTKGGPKQSFVGFMVYNRWWFHRDLYGFTLGGGMINNPGRYLVLLPPINGMSAASAALNSPYFTENPGDQFKAWDTSATFDYMPRQWLTFRFESNFRHANVPYWSGAGGITPPPGSNNGFPTQYACMSGATSGQMDLASAAAACAGNGGVWFPDLRHREFLLNIDLLVKF